MYELEKKASSWIERVCPRRYICKREVKCPREEEEEARRQIKVIYFILPELGINLAAYRDKEEVGYGINRAALYNWGCVSSRYTEFRCCLFLFDFDSSASVQTKSTDFSETHLQKWRTYFLRRTTKENGPQLPLTRNILSMLRGRLFRAISRGFSSSREIRTLARRKRKG
nr:PREDICTED: uncharacterized protein LOC105662674 isoform X1 [Megachile rotundata]XP_012142415.1 PREDICTED: uncharacterized protein LOC105662674 isoform X1 [Megachile rotundata]